MLAAGVGAAGHVELDLLVEAGETVLHLADQPLREALGLGDGELAELGAGAGDRPAPEGRDIDLETEGVELDDEGGSLLIRHVDKEDVLHDGGAELAAAVLVGEIGELHKLVAGDAAGEDAGADRGEAGLALRIDADVVAVDVAGNVFILGRRGDQLVAELAFQGFKVGLRGPAKAQEEIFRAGAHAVFAKDICIAEDLSRGLDDVKGLILTDEGGDAGRKERLGGESAADAQGVADLFLAVDDVLDRGQGDVVDLRVVAPERAAGDGDLEFAREVIESSVRAESSTTRVAKGEASISSS